MAAPIRGHVNIPAGSTLAGPRRVGVRGNPGLPADVGKTNAVYSHCATLIGDRNSFPNKSIPFT